MDELYAKLREHNLTAADFEGDRFIRLRTLEKRLDRISVAA